MELHTFLYDFVDVFKHFPEIKLYRIDPIAQPMQVNAYLRPTNKHHPLVINGESKEPINGLTEVIGIASVEHLRKILGAPGMNRKSVSAQYEDKRSLLIRNDAGSTYHYHFYDEKGLEHFWEPVKLREGVVIDYGVHFRPTQEHLKKMKYHREMMEDHYGGTFWTFTPLTKSEKLVFRTQQGGHGSLIEYPILAQTLGVLGNAPECAQCFYEYDFFIKLFALSLEVEDALVSFSDQGLCRVIIETTYFRYEIFILAFGEPY
jgi:hypothetical protein